MSNNNSLHEDNKHEQEHVENTDPVKMEAGAHHDARAAPVLKGGIRDPYHYSNHESVQYTHYRGIAYAALVLLFAGSQTALYFLGGNLNFISADIGGGSFSSWFPISYALSLAAVCPFTGYLSDLLSRRYVALLGQVFICVGTILIATAQHPSLVIAGASLSGIGGGIGEMSAQGGLGEMVPRKHRGNISALMIIGIIPFVPYVLWSQLLSTKSIGGWRHCFWISFAFNAFDFVVLIVAYFPPNEPLPEGVTRKTILRNIDWLGAFLAISGLTVLLYALQVGETVEWTKAGVLAPFFVGFFTLVVFFIYETKAALPIIPLDLFKANPRVMSLTFLITFISGANFFSLTNFVPLLVSTVYDASVPAHVGLRALGVAITTTIGATFFAPPLSRYPRHTKWIMLIATTMMTAFVGGMASTTPDNQSTFLGVSIMAGLGVGGIVVPAATIAVIASPDDLIGTVAAMTLSIRAVGGAIGNAIYFNVFYNQFPKSVVSEFPKRLLPAGLPATSLLPFIGAYTGGDTAALAQIPGVTPAVLEAAAVSLRWVYADSLKQVFLVSIAFGSASMIAAAFLKNLSEFVDSNEGMAVHRSLHKSHF